MHFIFNSMVFKLQQLIIKKMTRSLSFFFKKTQNLLSKQKYDVCKINQRRTENFTFIFFV